MAKRAKRDEALIERVDGLLSVAPVRRKAMFGSIAWFLESNGMMFTAVSGEGVMVRIGEERATKLIESGVAEQFPPGSERPMREYVFLDGDRITEDDVLLNWLEQASEFAADLPPKAKKNRRKTRKTN